MQPHPFPNDNEFGDRSNRCLEDSIYIQPILFNELQMMEAGSCTNERGAVKLHGMFLLYWDTLILKNAYKVISDLFAIDI